MPSHFTLNVSLTAQLRDFVDTQVASGRFSTASEVVRAGLRALERELPEASRPAAGRDNAHPGSGATATGSRPGHRSAARIIT
ncbi:MAG TPA: type II toxin-antitoxin system ParD family antitoxin [Acetobacteraceae bacterium]|jgi:putative addiction module CopG family antidote